MQSSPLYEPTRIWTLGLFLMLPQSGLRYRSWLLRSAPYAVNRAAEGPDDVMLSTQQRALMTSASAEPSNHHHPHPIAKLFCAVFIAQQNLKSATKKKNCIGKNVTLVANQQ